MRLNRGRPDRGIGPRRALIAAVSLLLAASIVAGCATDTPGSRGHAGEDETLAGTGDLVPPPGSQDAATGSRKPGGYYLDDGPGDRKAADLAMLAARPDPLPVMEPLHLRANRPYRVLGTDYRPMVRREPFKQQGVASWYGKKFHGQLTSIGERYDMYGMTAAHPTLPIPSYVRVTNLENNRRVVVRVNDRGPFLHGRIIDLSFLAAYKLGYNDAGSARVQVELIDPAIEAPAIVQVSGGARAPTRVSPAPVGGHFLQLGAFSAPENAEIASNDLRRRLDWLQVPIGVSPAGRLYRVRAGPFPLREQAVRAGTEVESRTGLRPLLLDP